MEIDQNDFKQLLTLLQKLVEKSSDSIESVNDDIEPDEPIDTKFKNKKATNKKSETSKSKKSKSVNKFLSMKERSMHKNDTEIDKKLNRFPPTERARKFEYVEVRCRVCGKTDKVTPGLAEAGERYKCNRCAASPG